MIVYNRTMKQHQLEWFAWFSGEPARLIDYYHTNKALFTLNGRFWGNLNSDEWANAVHMPLSQDIASISASLLFSESPDISAGEEQKANEYLQEYLNASNFESMLLEAAELCSAGGGVFLKLDTDPDIDDENPIITVRDPIMAKPTFRSNQLYAVEFYRVLEDDGKKQMILTEKRTRITNGYEVNYTIEEVKNNKRQLLEFSDVASNYEIDFEDTTVTGVDGIGVVYVPNILPNRLYPSSREGVSDIQGVISLLDSLDEAWSSWIRDIELGMSRLLVDSDMLKSLEPGATDTTRKFDPHNRAYLKMQMDEWRISGTATKPIESLQFVIRAEEHLKTVRELTDQIIARCGYSPQSFGLNLAGSSESGASLRIRERKSMITRNKKARYWQVAITELLKMWQQVQVSMSMKPRYDVQPVTVSISDSVTDDIKEISETIRNLSQAQAISTYMKVSMMYPDWTEEQITAEVDRINAETSVAPVGATFFE